MANDAIYKYASPITVSSSTATVAVGDISAAASTVSAISSANHLNYPLADVELSFSGTNSISSASATINLYRRDININGTADSPALSTATGSYYLNQYVGSFVAAATTASFSTAQELVCLNVPLSSECEFFIENKLNIPVGANWVLKITPKTFTPST